MSSKEDVHTRCRATGSGVALIHEMQHGEIVEGVGGEFWVVGGSRRSLSE